MDKELIIVFYSDKNYEYQAEALIQSALLNISGNFKLVYYTIDFNSELKYSKLQTIRIEKNESLPTFLYYKPSILLKSLENFGDQNFLFVDTDIIFGKRFKIEKIINQFDFPLCSQGNWEKPYMYYYTNGVYEEFNENKLMQYLGVEKKSMEYVYTCLISYNIRCKEILEDWNKICSDKKLLADRRSIFPFSDETSLNVLLWKRGIAKNFGRIYLNTDSFSPIELCEENEFLSGYGNNFGLFGNDLLRCDNSSNVIIYHGIKDNEVLKKTLEYFHSNKKRIFITFSEGKKYNELVKILNDSIETFSKEKLKVYSASDFNIKWEPEKWKKNYVYIYKILSCIKAIEEGYEQIIWLDNDIIVTENIDKIWSRFSECNSIPLLPKHRLFNFDFSQGNLFYPNFTDSKVLQDAKKRLGVVDTNFDNFYYSANFMIFNKECINSLKEVLSHFIDFDDTVFSYGDETILNCIIWREKGKNLGDIFICSSFFSPEVIKSIIKSNKDDYPKIFNKENFIDSDNENWNPEDSINSVFANRKKFSLPLKENNFDEILFIHGTKNPRLHKYYLSLLKQKKFNYAFLDSETTKGIYKNSFLSEIKKKKDSDETILCQLMKKFGSDKSTKHKYTKVYHELFNHFREKPIKIFELGLGTNNTNLPSNMGPDGNPGASLRGWREYFTNGLVYGADIDREILFNEDRIKTFYCDQTDSESINKMWKALDFEFDIIIDDGLHLYEANKNFLLNSINKIKAGGYFIIEDLLPETFSKFQKNIDNLIETELFDYKLIEVQKIKTLDSNLLIIRKKIDSSIK